MKQQPTSVYARQDMPRKSLTSVYIIAAIILAFGLYLIVPDRNNRNICSPAKTAEELSQTCEISYQGVEGKTALELLKSSHKVESQSFGEFGEFVQSIDEIKPGPTHFWAFYVNGEQAEVGASAYQTKDSDQITWKLTKIENQ